ncbi:MAG: hypothetical protein OXC31_01645 [Spirochaetaceae bacterium]|nr:hypothetical protein [Spirochaetaceae bacterium]
MTVDSKGRELFMVDHSVSGWTGLQYLEEWSGIAKAFDIATRYFGIGALLALDGKWQGLDKIRILMGAETTHRTRKATLDAVRAQAHGRDRRRRRNPRRLARRVSDRRPRAWLTSPRLLRGFGSARLWPAAAADHRELLRGLAKYPAGAGSDRVAGGCRRTGALAGELRTRLHRAEVELGDDSGRYPWPPRELCAEEF